MDNVNSLNTFASAIAEDEKAVQLEEQISDRWNSSRGCWNELETDAGWQVPIRSIQIEENRIFHCSQ